MPTGGGRLAASTGTTLAWTSDTEPSPRRGVPRTCRGIRLRATARGACVAPTASAGGSGTGWGSRGEGGREAALSRVPDHAMSVTGMSTTWISEPSIALTSYTWIVPRWFSATSYADVGLPRSPATGAAGGHRERGRDHLPVPVEDRDGDDRLEHVRRPADVHGARDELPDPRALDEDERQLVGEVRAPLGAVDLVAAEVRERRAVDLEPNAVDRVELRERVDDLREAADRDRRRLLRCERADPGSPSRRRRRSSGRGGACPAGSFPNAPAADSAFVGPSRSALDRSRPTPGTNSSVRCATNREPS